MSNPSSFRMPTHVAGIGAFQGEAGQFELAAEKAYEALLETLHEPMTAYAKARVPHDMPPGPQMDDCIIHLQLRYVRMILAKVNMDNFVDF